LLSNAVRNWPNNPLARYNAGIAALALGKREAAAAEFLEATRVDKEGVTDAALALAQMELQQGHYNRGIEFAHRFLGQQGRVQPPEKIAAAHRLLIQCYVELGRFALAEKSLKVLKGIEGQELAFAVEWAGFQKKKNGAKGAVTALRNTGIDLSDPNHRAALNLLIANLTSLKQTQKAVAEVEAAIKVQPDSSSLHVLLGEIYLDAGDVKHAEVAYRKALELDSEEANAQLGLAILMRDRGELEPALELLRSATERSPTGNHYFLTAGVLEQLGRGNEAIDALRLAVKADPGHTAALNNLAWLLAEQGTHLDEALEVAERAMRLAGTASAYDTLGWVRYKRGEYLQAERMFKQAIQRQAHPGYFYRLGLALEQSGKTPGALEAFEKALQINSQFAQAEEARTAVARLSQGQE
jgi:tetratricopeptide (TPR) repeat protein